jgi:FMN-dependent NADH-azoreductase
VARTKETLKYTENGPIGLLKGKQAILLITSGGTKLGSDIDFALSYLRHVLAFIGINDLTIIDSCRLGRDEENIINKAGQEMDALTLLS